VNQKFGSRSIDDERKRIKARFIMEAGDFGLVILRKDVADFQQELELLKIKIAAYKDVTYQTFHDKGFRKLLENRFGTDAIARLFSEHDVAPEKSIVSSPT